MLVNVEIKIAGSREFILTQFYSVVIKMNMFGLNYFELQLDETQIEGDQPEIMRESSRLIGKKVNIKFAPQDQTPQLFMKGLITKVSNHHLPDQSILIISGESADVLMNYGRKKRVFNNMSIKEGVKKIAAQYPADTVSIDINADGFFANHATTFLQYAETDYEFIRRLANASGSWFFNDGIKTYFGKPAEEQSIELINGINLNYFDLDTKAGGISYVANAYVPSSDEVISGRRNAAAPAGSSPLINTIINETKNIISVNEEVVPPPFLQNAQQLNDFIQIQYSQSVAELVSISGTSIDTFLKLGAKIVVKRPSTSESENIGEFRIVALTINITGSNYYSNSFTAISYSDYPPYQPSGKEHNIPPTVIGTVTDVNDPDNSGKVKVRFDWQINEEFYDWIQVLSPNSGNDSGFFFRPEVNEKVLVSIRDFLGTSQSFVIGSFHHGRATPDRWLRQRNNHIKGIRTKAGNEILLEDKGNDGRAISIQTSDDDSNYLWLVDNNGTTEIYLRSQFIRLMAEKDLEIYAGGVLKLQGTEVKISSGTTEVIKDSASQKMPMASLSLKNSGDTLLQSETKMEFSANTDITLTATANVNISATANFDLSANGKLSIAGTTSSFQGKVDVTIQGAIVRIN